MSEVAKSTSNKQRPKTASAAERLVALVGAICVAVVLGSMIWLAVFGENTAPDVEVEFVRMVPSGNDYLVKILVINHGGTTATQALVKGKLILGTTTLEESEVTIDYVPRHSEVQAGLFFDMKPDKDTLEFSVGGYQLP